MNRIEMYLESRLVQLALDKSERILVNIQKNLHPPVLEVNSERYAENFLANVLQCLSICGVMFFGESIGVGRTARVRNVQPKRPRRSRDTRAKRRSGPLAESISQRSSSPAQPLFSLVRRGEGINATGYRSGKGFVVMAGSKVSIHEAITRPQGRPIAEVREILLSNGILANIGRVFTFTQDYQFKSPSLAAGVCLGRESTGRVWKDHRRRELIS